MHSESTMTRKQKNALFLGAVGVVYGDIGTSPLYAIKECFHGAHGLHISHANILGILSLIFWAITLVVSLKYLVFIMRADNRGEGGILAMMALALRKVTHQPRLHYAVILMAIIGAALFYGDSVITPAISVLSAVEGLEVIAPSLHKVVIPVTIGILVALFMIQRNGTSRIGKLFAPVMVLWFSVLGLLGLFNIVQMPEVLLAVNPMYAIEVFQNNHWQAFTVLGSVVLALTGAEALYADMGHFGKAPIREAWFTFVKPALLLNYFGQGALLLRDPAAVDNPFFLLAPSWALIPLVLLATCAAVIASQAVISGAYSVSQQAVQLGFLPRLKVIHTSIVEKGQIYIPSINWGLLMTVILLVVFFRTSSNLAAAYGIAVTGTMVMSTILAWVVLCKGRSKRYLWTGTALAFAALIADLAFFGANALKIADGGWFPLLMGLVIFILLTTWKRGRAILMDRLQSDAMPLDLFIDGIGDDYPIRVPGTAIFLTSHIEGVPHALLHNLKHNKVLHERVVLLTVSTQDVPYVPDSERIEIFDLSKNFFRMYIKYGFKDDPDVPEVLEMCTRFGVDYNPMDTSFFLSRETLIASPEPGMAIWREKLFVAMSKNAQRAGDFFKIPTNRVVELGTQVRL